MSGTLRTLLGARAAAVVGRQAERAVLLDLADRDRPLVVAVHGIAGIGKSALLAAFAEDARAHRAAVVSLDCGGIEPTERGFLAALDRAIGALRAQPPGGTRPMATVAEAAAALSGLGDRVVLVLDTYEQLRLLDTWLRQELVPGLRDNTRLALAGREPPVAAWISDFGDLLARVPLANLAAADAGALLRREGLSGADAARVTRFTHGHPLALRLAASARGARPDLTVPDAAVATVVTELARVYLSGLGQPARAVLDAACTLRRPTLSLLGALLPDVPPHDAYDMAYGLHFKAFIPLDAGGPLTLQALRAGDIAVALLFNTGPNISAQHLVVLADDRALQPAENITPVVRRDVVARYGTRMLTLINAVSARLTTGSLRSLNAQAVLDGRRPRSAAEAWLRAQGLMQTGGVVH